MSPQAPEGFFRRQEGGGHPAFDPRGLPPAADAPGSPADSGRRTLPAVGGRQAAGQGRGNRQPIPRQAFLPSLAPAGRCRRRVSFQPLRQLLPWPDACFGLQPPASGPAALPAAVPRRGAACAYDHVAPDGPHQTPLGSPPARLSSQRSPTAVSVAGSLPGRPGALANPGPRRHSPGPLAGSRARAGALPGPLLPPL